MAGASDVFPFVSFIVAFLATIAVLFVLLRRAASLRLISHPNQRSSHLQPTPSGGGIAIALPVMVWCAASWTPFGITLAVAGGLLATIGLLDDIFDLPATPRLLAQAVLVSAGVAMVWPEQPPVLLLAEIIATVWFVNLFNFMDGIDGIATCQTLVFCLGVVSLSDAAMQTQDQLIWVLSGACTGFLLLNSAPARIFMGDAGSLFLGFVIPAVALKLHFSGQLPLISSVILLSAFIFDATWTLGVRILTGQSFASAHRSHLYQRLAERIGHRRTTHLFVAYALIWLMPLAWLNLRLEAFQWTLLIVSVLPVFVLSIKFRSGLILASQPTPAWERRE